MGPSILPAMNEPQDARPRARSPFTAAFLSLLFPGLGQLYAGAPARALAFAAAPILFIALVAGVALRMDKFQLVGLALNPTVLASVFAINLILLLYRLVAIIDAYRVAEYMNARAASGDGRLGKARLPRNALSIAGLLAILLVMAGSHVVVARYDMLASSLLDSDCIFIGGQATSSDCDVDASASPDASSGASTDTSDEPSLEPTAAPTPEPTPVGSDVPAVSIPPWDGKQRLNVLLIGTDQRPNQGSYNTDTLIVVSIDPVTKQVAMFSLPRDTENVPVPPGPAQRLFGTVYGGKINSWFQAVRNRADLYPGNSRTRGYNGLKDIIGNLYNLDIKYFVEVNFDGFRSVVDAVGGVTINVQIPVSDDRYPGEHGTLERVYIPSGIQHMDGAQALRYARSRHGASDFDRGQRQQRVLLSLREQTDPQALIPHLPDLVTALKKAVRTDVPVDQLAPLLGLASQVDTKNIRSYVFAPPLYGSESPPGASTLLHPPQRGQDPRRGQERVHDGPGRRGPARETRRRGRQRLGPQWHRRLRARVAGLGLSRVLRIGLVGTPTETGRFGPGRHHDRRLQRRRDRAALDHRLSREDVRGDRHDQDGPGHPDRHRRHDRARHAQSPGADRPLSAGPDAERRRRVVGARPARSPYSIAVSQWAYSGRRPRTASK